MMSLRSASVDEVAAACGRGALIIDVRAADEYAAAHIPNAVFMPLHTVPLRLAELDRSSSVYVVCESGARSFQACQYLEQNGFQAINVIGAMGAWRAAGLPVQTGMVD